MASFLNPLHVLGAALFVGDIVLMMIWRHHAERAGDPRVAAFAARTIQKTDQWVLKPSVLLLVVSGNLAAHVHRVPLWTRPALAWAVGFYTASGIVWFCFLVPIQKRQAALCAELGEGGSLPAAYFELSGRWTRWAFVAAFFALGALLLMAA